MVGGVGLGQDPMRQLPLLFPVSSPTHQACLGKQLQPFPPWPCLRADDELMGWWVGGLVGMPSWEPSLLLL